MHIYTHKWYFCLCLFILWINTTHETWNNKFNEEQCHIAPDVWNSIQLILVAVINSVGYWSNAWRTHMNRIVTNVAHWCDCWIRKASSTVVYVAHNVHSCEFMWLFFFLLVLRFITGIWLYLFICLFFFYIENSKFCYCGNWISNQRYREIQNVIIIQWPLIIPSKRQWIFFL